MDLPFLYRFGISIKNVHALLFDRGLNYVRGPQGDDAFEIMGHVYKRAVELQCSLAEAATLEYSTSMQTTTSATSEVTTRVYFFDRNYDVLKRKDRMISTDQVKYMQEQIRNECLEGRISVIVVSPNKLSPQAKKEYLQAELFLFDDLLFNLPKHEYYIPHRQVTKEHVYSVLGSKLQLSDLPVLPKSDPVARWFGWPSETLVFVDNPCMPTFRIVQ
jgi:hypothetical protein